MFRMISFLGLIIVISCGRIEKEKGMNNQKTKEITKIILSENDSIVGDKKTKINTDSLFLSHNVDSVEILCLFFGEYGEKSFRVFLTNKGYSIFNTYDERNIISGGVKSVRDSLISNINHFYIDEKMKVKFNKVKRDYIKSMDYPCIKVIGYRNRKKVFNKTTQMGDEEYEIDYNPKFLEFYELLDNLVK